MFPSAGRWPPAILPVSSVLIRVHPWFPPLPFVLFVSFVDSLWREPRIEPVGVVVHVAAVGVIDQQFQLLRAANVNRNRHGRIAATEDRTGKPLLAIDQHAEYHASTAGGGIVDADVGLEAGGSWELGIGRLWLHLARIAGL